MLKQIAKLSLIGITAVAIGISLVLIINSIIASGLITLTNYLQITQIPLNTKTALTGGILLTALNGLIAALKGGYKNE